MSARGIPGLTGRMKPGITWSRTSFEVVGVFYWDK